ncbi:conserved Plasmodium protein, unknown function [Plasmodium vinckei petteri]|uniref:Uncharacterized protein n=1 Tax=Plasmodium vinckei petteri TaxID=138298 RepID=A0A6V7TE41_PLAVN|nr:conserved Plasmodium protein, unknown function [Plasmodium vinckei petteri]
MKECDEILELEEIQNTILNKNKKYDYEFLINIFLIFFHLLLYINIIGIYYTYNNETFKTCFNNSVSHIIQNSYFNIKEIETIDKNLGAIKDICNYKKIDYLKNVDDNLIFSLNLHNNHSNTYIDYIISFNRIFKSEIFKEERYLAISHKYLWTEWILYILFNAVTIFRIYKTWDIKKLNIYRTKKNLKNVAYIVIVVLFNLNILYEQIIGSIYCESMQAKIFEGLIYIYNIFIILNIFNEISKIHKTFNIPIKIIQNINGESNGDFSLIDNLSDAEQLETKYIYNFFFTIIYQYFIIPMIIILSTTTTFLLIHKNKHDFKEQPINIPFLKTLKKYVFLFSEKKKIVPYEIDHNFNNIENVEIERDREKVKSLKIVNLSLFFIFFILFIFNIIVGRNYYPHVTEHFSGLLGEPFVSESKQGISFDTLTSQEEYYNFLNSVILNNIMKNKKSIENKKLYELESNITNSDIFLYENYFPVFPYDIYIKFGGTQKDDVTLESSLFFYNSGTAKAGLNQYKHLFDDSEGNSKNYETHSILYNFENDLLVLIKTSLNTHYNGQREQKKEIIVYEIRNEKTSMDIIKMISLGSLVVIAVAYFMLTIYLSYYHKINNIYMNCLLFSFFLILFLFLLFNIMSYKSISHYNNYIEKIKNKNISTIYSMEENFLEWIMKFYHIKMISSFSVYDILNDALFYFFSFYMTSIYIYMFLKKSENIIKLKFQKKNEYSLHVDNLIIEDHDMQIYFKAIIYKIDKIFEKLRIIKEDNYISQTINQYIQFHNYACQKNEFLKRQNYIPYYDDSNIQTNNNKIVDTNLEEKQITDKKMSGDKILNISTTPQNEAQNHDVNTLSISETNEKSKNTKEDFEKYEQVKIVEQIENMSLFFTKVLSKKYDFNFLSGDIEKCKTRNGQVLRKKEKKKKILENMIINLLNDLEYIENIKTMYTYIVFLKIKKHILINSIQNFNSNKIELKEQYENKFIYQKHLVNLKKILNNEMQTLKENICIQRDLKGSLVQIIEDECFYKKDTHEEK